MQADGLATQSVDILLKDAFLLCGSTRKTPLPHRLGGVHKEFKTLGAHLLAPAHRRGALSSSRRAPHYSSRRGPRMASPRFRHEPS